MLERFRGTLYGLLVGDCFGALFQEATILSKGSRLVLRKFLDKLEDGSSAGGLRKPYTDDTSLTLAVSKTLISAKQIDQNLLARNYVAEYSKNVNRDYAASMCDIFVKLDKTDFVDVLGPAKEQLMSEPDNCAAMCVAPVALLCFKNNDNQLIDLVRDTAAVTHSHELSVNGAILQAIAVHTLLNTEKTGKFDIDKYLNGLIESMNKLENTAFCQQIENVERLLKIQDPSEEKVVDLLGHSYQALYSVPTAIYCFLRTIKWGDEKTAPFRQNIEYAITLGGHANTITSMTGALSGAYYGESSISENILRQCEGFDEVKSISEQLYKV